MKLSLISGKRGFSLFDILLAMFVSMILSLIAVPSISDWLKSAKSKEVSRQLLNITAMARYQALTRSSVVTICHLEDNRCAGQLAFPLSVFEDGNRNAAFDPQEDLIRELDIALSESVDINWNRRGYLRFWPSGGTGALTGSLSYCDAVAEQHNFRLVVARTGRTRIDRRETRCPSNKI